MRVFSDNIKTLLQQSNVEMSFLVKIEPPASSGMISAMQQSGVYIENKISNSEIIGAVAGVIGSGGVLPTGWTQSTTPPGISKTVVGTGILENGMPYLDYRISGTSTSGGTSYSHLLFDTWPGTAVPVVLGETWVHSAYVQIIAGSNINFVSAPNITVAEYSAAGSYLTESGSSAITTSMTRKVATRLISNASVSKIRSYLNLPIANALPVDITLRIAGMQVEKASSASAYMPTNPNRAFLPSILETNAPTDIFIPSIGTFKSSYSLQAVDAPRLSTSVDRETFRINYIDPDLSKRALFEAGLTGASVKVYACFNNVFSYTFGGVSSGQPLWDPNDLVLAYSGRVDSKGYAIDPDSGTIIATIEGSSPLAALAMSKGFYTSKEHLKNYSTVDTAFDQVSVSSSKVVYKWGKI
jgi:hypothetical protein